MHGLSRIGVFDDLFNAANMSNMLNNGGVELRPTISVKDSPTAVVVEAEVPGIPPEAIELSITGSTITIKGEKQRELTKTDDTGKIIYSERSFGSFARKVKLPSTVDPDSAIASSKDGVLIIKIDKIDKARRIEIKHE